MSTIGVLTLEDHRTAFLVLHSRPQLGCLVQELDYTRVVISKPASQILPIRFVDAEFAGRVDVRRWRAGERNTRYGRSPVHGFGSFAIRRIPRGGAVMVREPLSGNFPVNHSESPNTGRAINRAGLFALSDIAAGEEITEDYRFLPYFDQAIPVIGRPLLKATPGEYRRFLQAHGFEVEAAAKDWIGPAGNSLGRVYGDSTLEES